jgi:hypothetical protein
MPDIKTKPIALFERHGDPIDIHDLTQGLTFDHPGAGRIYRIGEILYLVYRQWDDRFWISRYQQFAEDAEPTEIPGTLGIIMTTQGASFTPIYDGDLRQCKLADAMFFAHEIVKWYTQHKHREQLEIALEEASKTQALRLALYDAYRTLKDDESNAAAAEVKKQVERESDSLFNQHLAAFFELSQAVAVYDSQQAWLAATEPQKAKSVNIHFLGDLKAEAEAFDRESASLGALLTEQVHVHLDGATLIGSTKSDAERWIADILEALVKKGYKLPRGAMDR